MPFCPKCGSQLSDAAKFCASCGEKILPPVVEEPVYIPVVEEPVYVPAAEPETIPENQIPMAEEPVPVEPVYVAPVVEEPVTPVVKKEKTEKVPLITKKPLGIGKKILVVFLWILAFIFGFATVATFCVHSVVNEDLVALVLEDVDLGEIAASSLIYNADEDDTIVDWLRGELIKLDPNWERLSTKDLEDFIDTQIKPFVAEKGGEFLEVLLTGKGEAAIKEKDIRKLVDSSVEFIYEEYGVYITDEMAEDLIDYITSFKSTELENFYDVANTEYLKEQYPELENIPTVVSVLPLVIFGALAAIFLILILLVNKSLIRNLNSVGSLATAVGAVYSIATGVVLLAPDLLADLYGELEFIGTIVEQVASNGLMIALPLLGGGIVVLVFSKLLQSIKIAKK